MVSGTAISWWASRPLTPPGAPRPGPPPPNINTPPETPDFAPFDPLNYTSGSSQWQFWDESQGGALAACDPGLDPDLEPISLSVLDSLRGSPERSGPFAEADYPPGDAQVEVDEMGMPRGSSYHAGVRLRRLDEGPYPFQHTIDPKDLALPIEPAAPQREAPISAPYHELHEPRDFRNPELGGGASAGVW